MDAELCGWCIVGRPLLIDNDIRVLKVLLSSWACKQPVNEGREKQKEHQYYCVITTILQRSRDMGNVKCMSSLGQQLGRQKFVWCGIFLRFRNTFDQKMTFVSGPIRLLLHLLTKHRMVNSMAGVF